MKVLKTKDLMELLGVGRTKMYQILQANILPTTKIGYEYFTTEEQMNEWFKRNSGKSIKL